MKDDIKKMLSDMREYLNDVVHKECKYNIYLDLWDMLDKLESTIVTEVENEK